MSHYEKDNDPRFHKGSPVAPFIFMVLFILFIYSPLLIGLLLVARWIIDANNLTFFLNLGTLGDLLMLFIVMASWILIVLSLSIIPYLVLRSKGRFILAEKVAVVIRLLLFHIFAFPFICWRMVRNNSPKLRSRYRQKLKAMVKGKKMQERKIERLARMQDKLRSV
ncbi:hypothetical protein N5853_12390 [Bartonella sp. HY329]|uniref:hypothetical protein n=1 Tax=unclassified Bartonella TaxID=2645622 RepID=UPI0021C7900F|nr:MULTISPECIES: hypothetical protein [unclassified Bartonella]UXM94869.1 hypothetical protein N5853_12390 [Bartonella sp. HY329]UXN09192.1 hypothetical protein N5852_12400 [Bartonella sp. HY328]